MSTSDAMATLSPTKPRTDNGAATHNEKGRKRNPLESLSSFVNSLEIKTMGSKISHSASSLRRSVSQRFGELPLFPSDETSDDDMGDNESTLEDGDLLASPSSRPKAASSRQQDFVQDANRAPAFASNERLPSTPIHTFAVSQDNLPRIDEHEMSRIVRGERASSFDEIVIVDCRFPYEYEGGHISGALNLSSQQALEEHFFWGTLGEIRARDQHRPTTLIIFHCEYSLLRGPTLATHLRKFDRQLNAHRYPYLHFPDVVVLEHGYKGFFDRFRPLCEPQQYVPMNDSSHRRTCEIEMGKVMQAQKLPRAKSYTQFPPRLNLAHSRSSSLTALLTTEVTSVASAASTASVNTNIPASIPTSIAGAAMPRSRRSLKIKKRERTAPRPQFTQSLSNFQAAFESPTRESPVLARFESDDFLPPSALFRHHSRSSAGSFRSLNSSSSSLCSESLSPTMSSESLSESVSPFYDQSDFCRSGGFAADSDPSFAGFEASKDSGPVYNSGAIGSFAAHKPVRPPLSRPSLRPFKTEHASPVSSSPLSFAPVPAFPRYSAGLSNDVINEAPIEFSSPPRSKKNVRLVRNNQSSVLE